jgi:hypothetical protein
MQDPKKSIKQGVFQIRDFFFYLISRGQMFFSQKVHESRKTFVLVWKMNQIKMIYYF